MRPRIKMPMASSYNRAINKEYSLVKDAIKGIKQPNDKEVWKHYAFERKTKQLDNVGLMVYETYRKAGMPTYKFGRIYVVVL